MANTAAAAKAARKSKKRQAVNSARKSRVRTSVRAVEDALAKGDQAAAAAALKKAEPEIQRGANKGVMHKNAASRKVSRLTKRVKALSKA
jgi:small subunit ribosomal protein S20